MNTAEMLTAISANNALMAENTQKVFEAGKAQGGGGDSYYDTFWDGLQDYGKRTQYQYFLYYIGTIDWFRPKYDIRPKNATWFARDFGKEIQNTFTEVCITSGIHDLNLVSHHLYVLLSLLRTSQSLVIIPCFSKGCQPKSPKTLPKVRDLWERFLVN